MSNLSLLVRVLTDGPARNRKLIDVVAAYIGGRRHLVKRHGKAVVKEIEEALAEGGLPDLNEQSAFKGQLPWLSTPIEESDWAFAKSKGQHTSEAYRKVEEELWAIIRDLGSKQS
jgi:hypothetical protein